MIPLKDAALSKLHPETYRQLKKGHPWVTADSFSNRFPRRAKFIQTTDPKSKASYLLIHDPTHPKVKARLWSTDRNALKQNFLTELKTRLENAIKLRLKSSFKDQRDNYYLAFGEADQLPGLFIQKLGPVCLVQLYGQFWNGFRKPMLEVLKKHFKADAIYFQFRNENKKLCWEGKLPHQFEINEFGVKYRIKFGDSYDFGLYTDMSSIRQELLPIIKDSKRVLNLYSYTGAYSLFSIKSGAEQVVSVDLSRPYLDWLEENLSLNTDYQSKHQSICLPSKKAMDNMAAEDQEFDLIICDPPSSSSDGKKTTSALQEYPSLLKKMEKILSPGGKLVLFLNTHGVKRQRFEKVILENTKFKKVSALSPSEDCQALKNFPEGDYLKGIVLTK